MLDHGRAALGHDDAHQVDAHTARWCPAVFLEPALGQAAQTLGLGGGHRRHRVLEGRLPAGLHLADDQGVAVAGHDVDLARPAAAPIAVKDRHPGLGQPPRGQLFAVLAECASCVHVGTTSDTHGHVAGPHYWILVRY